jgi:hypothetical protein
MEPLLRILTIFVIIPLCLFGFFTVMNILFAEQISKTRNPLQQATRRSFGVGLVNVLFFLPVSLVLLSLSNAASGPLGAIVMLPGLFLLAVLLGLASFGLACIVNRIGEQVMPNQLLLKRTFWGTLLLSLACGLPFVGWFLLLPYVLIVGVGAAILGFFQKSA